VSISDQGIPLEEVETRKTFAGINDHAQRALQNMSGTPTTRSIRDCKSKSDSESINERSGTRHTSPTNQGLVARPLPFNAFNRSELVKDFRFQMESNS